VRVVIADDHALIRHGLRVLFETQKGWIVTGEATNGREAVALAMDLQPDLVVLDISMPEMSGLQAAGKIRELLPGTKIVILSMHDSPQAQKEALRAGADAFLTKTADPAEMFKVIEGLGLS
jgi:two-component system, NarL family, nitrate/nitrite response regulator NarL